MKLLTVFLFLTGIVSPCAGQEFEVATMRLFKAVSHGEGMAGSGMAITREPTILRARGVTLDHLVRWAYQLKTYELVDHDWKQWREVIGMQPLYALEAQFKPSASDGEVRLMLRKLLQERVGLLCHQEKHEVEGYVATVSAKGLSKAIRKTTQEPAVAGELASSKPVLRLGAGANSKEVAVSVVGATMAEILDEISGMLRAPLVDATELTDRFDATWKMDFGEAKTFEAFQEAALDSLRGLGLNTARSKVLVNGLVIDHVAPLTGN